MDDDKQSGLEEKLGPHEEINMSTKKFVRNGILATSPLFLIAETLLGYKTIEAFSEGNYDNGIVTIMAFGFVGYCGSICLKSYKILTQQISKFNHDNCGGK